MVKLPLVMGFAKKKIVDVFFGEEASWEPRVVITANFPALSACFFHARQPLPKNVIVPYAGV